MKTPYVEYSKDDWFAMTHEVKKGVFREIMQFLVAIDEKQHPLQNDIRQGAIAAEKRSLEKFIQQVILWERSVDTKPSDQPVTKEL